MADFGHDVADHCDVDWVSGTLADFDRLVAVAHARGLRVILDYVPNHSSERHPWFLESGASRASPKQDWYIWRNPAPDGGPPDNWLSEFGGRAWTLDAATGQYHYHAYLPQQPDLNWRSPQVRAAMLEFLRFWLDRGVDGFRVDAIHRLFEHDQFRDNPPNSDWRPGMPPARQLIGAHTMDQPEVHEAVAANRAPRPWLWPASAGTRARSHTCRAKDTQRDFRISSVRASQSGGTISASYQRSRLRP